jgi:phosphoribosylformylglycinamidine synthase
VAIAECAMANGIGLDATSAELGSRVDASLFGESGNRAVVSVEPGKLAAVEALAASKGLPLVELGHAGGDRIRLGAGLDLPIDQMAAAYREALPSIMA